MTNLLKYPYSAEEYACFAAQATKLNLEISILDNRDLCMVAPKDDRLGYRRQREISYPPLADQLDMIYHDMINGTSLWPELIASIKKQYPKK